MGRLTVGQTAELLQEIFAPWIRTMGLEPVSIHDSGAEFRLNENTDLVHVGGVICGQASAAAADTAAVLTLCAHNGKFRPVTTVDLTCHFIRPLPPGPVNLSVTIDANGKRMAYIRIAIRADGSEKIAVSFTGAFMYLEE